MPRTTPLGEPRILTWMAGALIAIAALLAYANSLTVPFLFDDYESIQANPTIERLTDLGEVLQPPANGSGVTGRPIVNLSLAVNHALGGTTEWGYHALNVAFHVLAGLTLFGLVRRTARLPALRDRHGDTAFALAWLVAAIWTVHPLQTESVTCVIQRTELLAGFFYLLTLYGFVRSLESPHRWRWEALSVAACALGMGSKEIMVSAPLLVLLYDRTLVTGSFRAAWRERRRYYGGLAATWVGLIYLVAGGGGTRGTSAGFGLGVSPFDYALKQAEAIFLYLRLAVWPHPLVLDYGEDLSVHPVGVWFAVAGVSLLVAGTAVALWRRHVLGLIGAGFLAILAPSSSFVPLLTQTVAEHRMYLPLAAVVVVLIAVTGLARFRHRWIIGAAVVALLGGVTARRNHDYRSGLAIWSDTVTKAPRNSRAHHNLGSEYAKLPGHSAEAIAAFERALDCKPTDMLAHFNLANEFARNPDQRDRAIQHYEAALRIIPGYAYSHINLANMLARDPLRRAEAIAHYETALRLKPDSSAAHNNLANELAKVPDRVGEALHHYEAGLRLKPDDPELHFNLANLLARLPGRLPDALRHYERAVDLRPAFVEAHFRLGNELTNLPGRMVEAIPHYEEALEHQPGHLPARYNLGVVFANLGRTALAIRQFEALLKLDPDSADARQSLELLRSLPPPSQGNPNP